MADTTALKNRIRAAIKANNNQEITGPVLQQALLDIVDELDLYPELENEAQQRHSADTTLNNLITGIKNNIDNGYVYAGIAVPSTVPVSGKVFYVAIQTGTYTNFGDTAVVQGINILKYGGSAWSKDAVVGIDSTPTQGSNNLITSGGVQNELALGAVYDVSAKNPTAGPNNDGKFTLEYILNQNNVNTLIPTAVRKGGVSIKFVQTSDNKYVQYRLMTTSFSTTESDWQGVDDEPTDGSHNLVESGGVLDFGIKSKVLSDYSGLINIIDLANADTAMTTPSGNIGNNIIFSQNTNYKTSEDITLKKGDTVYIRTYVDNKYVCPVAIKDNNGYKQIVVTNPKGEYDFVYTADNDCVVKCCANINHYYKCFVTVKGAKESEVNALSQSLVNTIEDVENVSEKVDDGFISLNVFDTATKLEGKYVYAATGQIQTSSDPTDYAYVVQVESGKIYHINRYSNNISQVWLYQEDDTPIGDIYDLGLTDNWNKDIIIPEGAAILKATVTNTYRDSAYFGEFYEYWLAGKKLAISDKVLVTAINGYIKIGAGCQISSLKEGFQYARANNLGVIIEPGVYSLLPESVSDEGLLMPKHIIGYGAKITSMLSEENWNFSPLNTDRQLDGTIVEGLEVEVSNCRYCIHDEEYTKAGAYHNVFKNLSLIHHSSPTETLIAPRAIGGGLGNVGVVEIFNCYLESGTHYGDVDYHSHATGTQTGNCRIYVHDNQFAHAVSLTRIGNSTDFLNTMFVSNCLFGQHLPASGTDYNTKVVAWNNVLLG